MKCDQSKKAFLWRSIILSWRGPSCSWCSFLFSRNTLLLNIRSCTFNVMHILLKVSVILRFLWKELHWRLPPESMWKRGSVPQEAQLLPRLHLWLRGRPLRAVLPTQVGTDAWFVKTTLLSKVLCYLKPSQLGSVCVYVCVCLVLPCCSTSQMRHVIHSGRDAGKRYETHILRLFERVKTVWSVPDPGLAPRFLPASEIHTALDLSHDLFTLSACLCFRHSTLI